MTKRMLQFGAAASIIVVSAAGSTACATKKYVRTEVGAVNTKVDNLTRTVEETQERTRKNEARIAEVDTKADAAGRSAAEARTAANTADTKAVAASTKAETATAKADEVDKSVKSLKRLIYEVVLNEAQGNFAFGKVEMPDAARGEIDKLVDQLKNSSNNAYIEIEGHTDSVGGETYNERLGLERAQSVRQYLYENHQVPLHRMNVISFGEGKPIAPNNTRAGRAQNRRVVIRVLA
jgi:outer membrane protein OmpA-like peptidoglycan-associated protein